MTASPEYSFLANVGRILNSGQARTVLLTGSIHDLFFLKSGDEGEGDYVPLLPYLTASWGLPDRILAVYEVNGPIRFLRDSDRDKIKDAWLKLRTGLDANQLAVEQMLNAGRTQAELSSMSDEFDANLHAAIGKPTLALELLRQLCLASRAEIAGRRLLREKMIILVEAADLLIPNAEITRLSDAGRHRVAICHDWFSDPGFMTGDDAVILLAESRSLLNQRIAALPQLLEVEVDSADRASRHHFISWFDAQQTASRKLQFSGTHDDLAGLCAGLSIHAVRQLLAGACHEQDVLSQSSVIDKVQDYIKSRLGEEMVEFKKPSHTLDDVVGFTQLKQFLNKELIPRFQSSGPDALPGAAVAGPIGSGKTFLFEAVASELNMVVLVLKNIRSQWYGQTDVLFERLRRVLNALSKVLIFVDEADTQFGRVDAEAHATERRLTGKIQAMMSDPQLRGRVIWLLMTARIHRLSPDIRRPGRTGDLIIPVLDPTGEDREAFVQWMAAPVLDRPLDQEQLERLDVATAGYSAASFASLRSELIARSGGSHLSFDRLLDIADDIISPDIGRTRRYQTLQALVNCTRRSLLPADASSEQREAWREEIRQLEAEGIS